MTDFVNSISGLSTSHLLVLVVLVVAVLYSLPLILRRLRISRIGSVEFDKHSTDSSVLQLFQLTSRLHEVDVDFREAVWAMTDGLFDDLANNSDFNCSVCVSHVLFSISDYIRSLILLGISYQFFTASDEEHTMSRLRTGVSRGVRRSREIHLPDKCPVKSDMDKVLPDRYEWAISDWVVRARSLAGRYIKIRVSESELVLKSVSDPYVRSLVSDMLGKDKSLYKAVTGGDL